MLDNSGPCGRCVNRVPREEIALVLILISRYYLVTLMLNQNRGE